MPRRILIELRLYSPIASGLVLPGFQGGDARLNIFRAGGFKLFLDPGFEFGIPNFNLHGASGVRSAIYL